MLVDSPDEFLQVSAYVSVPIAVATGLITVFLVGSVVKAQRRPVQTGSEGLVGQSAIAQADFQREGDEYIGQVFVHGEIWNARSGVPVTAGQSVPVLGRHGLALQLAGGSPGDRPHKGDVPTEDVVSQNLHQSTKEPNR